MLVPVQANKEKTAEKIEDDVPLNIWVFGARNNTDSGYSLLCFFMPALRSCDLRGWLAKEPHQSLEVLCRRR